MTDYNAYMPSPRPAPRDTLGAGSRLMGEPMGSPNDLLEAIRAKAIALWGSDRWTIELTRTYCEIYCTEGDTARNFNAHSSSIKRTFARKPVGNISLDRVFKLAACVDMQVLIK